MMPFDTRALSAIAANMSSLLDVKEQLQQIQEQGADSLQLSHSWSNLYGQGGMNRGTSVATSISVFYDTRSLQASYRAAGKP
jgi:hypothetical protein